jgi:quinohemoprotein ethanol dehydrogenase
VPRGGRGASATPRVPASIGPAAVDGQRGGVLLAWDPVTQKERWRVSGGGGAGGGTMVTASNLLFQTLNDGRLLAYTADKGEKLLDLQTGLPGGLGPPITYMLDGQQYVALMGGTGQAGGGRGGKAETLMRPRLLVFTLDGKEKLLQ